MNVVEQTWAEMGIHATSRSVYPDDTTMVDWYYLFQHYFPANYAPDLVVIGFVRSQLSDQTTVHANRIAAHFGGFRIANEVLTTDLTNLGDRIDFLLSTESRMFSERDRLRETVLRALVPRYSDTAQSINIAAQKAKETGDVHLTYGRLTRFIRLCRERGTLPLFIAMPLPAPYDMDKDLVSTIISLGGLVWDFRGTQGLNRKDFLDPLHLAPSGAIIYTKRLAPALASLNRVRTK